MIKIGKVINTVVSIKRLDSIQIEKVNRYGKKTTFLNL